jgi:hypothetical protein
MSTAGVAPNIALSSPFGSGQVSEPKLDAAVSKIHRDFITTG